MVEYRPSNSYVIYGGEVGSFGAGGTPNTNIGIVTNFSPSFKNTNLRLHGVGDGRNAILTAYGMLELTGTVDFQVIDFNFFRHLIGPRTGSGTSGAPYVLTEADNYSQSASSGIQIFTMEAAGYDETTDDVETYKGCWINSATLNFSLDTPLNASVNWGASTVTGGTSAAGYTANTRVPYLMQSGTFSWGTAPTAVTRVQSGSITIYNNPVIMREVGSRFVTGVAAGQRMYDFTVELIMTDALRATLEQDLYGQAVASGPATGIAAASPPANRELALVFTISGTDTAQILLNDCYIEERTKPIPIGNELIRVTYTGWAHSGGNTANTNQPLRWWTS